MAVKFDAQPQDDPAFVSLVERIVNGALASLQPREVYIVHIDNWFDYKWLGWWSWNKEKGLCIPPFNPNRVLSQTYFRWNSPTSLWESHGSGNTLHIRQPGLSSRARPAAQLSDSGSFIWYSGNTVVNKMGCLMLYLSGADGYCWYASFRKNCDWKTHDVCRITRRELTSFEERGDQIEPHSPEGQPTKHGRRAESPST